ncbi:GNAT family N-acetyltransferase [Alkalimonas collagenimarina]|uniref:GNAT family N-acetyltransferase n=1 Tax=Alkalimonas collagenimarina TaxID=400390 RepID=A0ABT9H3G6_9GAMM|nr:GNAT family N-acetyltransferase [Alkalimonas collagenimarina]MDP4537445.1 GNAT family N-acetyltransferase [Alkalimonas collagenimarina]
MYIRPYRSIDAESLLQLATKVHGDGYLDKQTLQQFVELGCAQGINASFVAYQDSILVGYRLSFSAGRWQADRWCSPQLWPVAAADMAYFKSVAVEPGCQGQGIGSALLQASVDVLQQQGAKAGLAHLWQQSPGNSAVRYFTKAGGKLIAVHQDKWLALSLNDGYFCPVCQGECHCSAAEMVLQF